MDYEKKYKNLVKVVKELQEANPSDEGIQNWVKDNVPELAESEDEKIRKHIYNYINVTLDDNESAEKEKWLDWLENQGDIDKPSYEIAEKEKRRFVGDGFIKCCANFQDFKGGETYWLEYVGGDNYNVRSDNLLGKTYHITPCQLYTIFKKQTWLEKQGEQKVSVVKFNAEDWYVSKVDGKIYNAKFVEQDSYKKIRRKEIEKAAFSASGNVEHEVWFIKGAEWADENPSYISSEKQGERKEATCVADIIDHLTEKEQEILFKELEMQKVQKSINDTDENIVKAKFKVGDWVVFKNKHQSIYQVEKIEDGYYILRHTHGGTFRVCILHDEDLRLWSIVDAKDGDVLWHSDSASNGIFIFKEIRYDGKVLCYCDYDSEDHFCLGEHHTCCWSNAKYIKPATKEQRNLLFSKMKEAGYEWDTNNKELMKIEEELTDFENSLKHIMIETLECGDTRNLKADAEMLLRFAQKPKEWSEEDEKRLKSCLNILQAKGIMGVTETINTKWLKSLKERLK